jgi:hypothetical protein
MKPNTKAKE